MTLCYVQTTWLIKSTTGGVVLSIHKSYGFNFISNIKSFNSSFRNR